MIVMIMLPPLYTALYYELAKTNKKEKSVDGSNATTTPIKQRVAALTLTIGLNIQQNS
jgi:hypothetical protein